MVGEGETRPTREKDNLVFSRHDGRFCPQSNWRLASVSHRFGGDEFVIMLSLLDIDEAESIAQAANIAEILRVALSESSEFPEINYPNGRETNEVRDAV